MSTTRRSFLKLSAAAASLASTYPLVFRRAVAAVPPSNQPGAADTILVVVQLSGGNDGLNTVIPASDPLYQKLRPTLGVKPADVLKISDGIGLNPSLKGFADLLNDSQLAVIQGVGYPQPNRSHFESMDIWHKATLSPKETLGWLGRTVPHLPAPSGALHISPAESPLALYGPTGNAPSFRSLEDYRLRFGNNPAEKSRLEKIKQLSSSEKSSAPLANFLRQSTTQTFRSAEEIHHLASNYEPKVTYPETDLARHLKLIAQLIDAGVPERIYYTSLDGFDTHAVQPRNHPALLETLSAALSAFHKDLAHHGHHRRVLSVVFSEFGRRVKENNSLGTDHGAAAPMFLVGHPVAPGLHGDHPKLTDLDDGDLKFHTDFRSVYATLLDRWLRVDQSLVLEQKFPTLNLLKSPAS